MPISWPDDWFIEPLKITDYLLNLDHEDGHAKARLLLACGFRRNDPDTLSRALLGHVHSVERRILEGPHGTRFVFEGPLTAPDRLVPHFRSVWLRDAEHRAARLITAYPFDAPKA